MAIINNLLKQVNLLNCLLVVVIIATIGLLLIPMLTSKIAMPSTAPAAVEPIKSASAPPAVMPPFQDYAIITEKNLFHPGRILPPLKKVEEVPRPEFVLYGTLVTDFLRIAYMTDNKQPRNTPGRGKRQTAVKLGETMSGYALLEVQPDRVVMARGDDRIEVLIIAPGVKKNRGADGTVAVPTKPGTPAAAPAGVAPATPPARALPPGALPPGGRTLRSTPRR
jgi:hypothetical protein